MSCQYYRVASLFCISLVLANAAPCFAVNLEFAAAAPNERLGVSAHAALTATGGVNLGSTEGIAGLPDAYAFTGALHLDANNSGTAVSSDTLAGLYTNIAFDSPAAYVTLMTPGAELPPELNGFDINQWAKGLANEVGSTYQASWSAMSALDTFDKFNPLSVDWVIDVLPSAGEIPGTPVRIQVDAVIEGVLSSTGSSNANSSWLVVAQGTQVLAGSAGLSGLTLPFGGTASDDFVLPLGSSFDLRFLWTASASGNDFGTSQAEFTAGRIDLSATIIPEPSSLLLVSLGLLGLPVRAMRRRAMV